MFIDLSIDNSIFVIPLEKENTYSEYKIKIRNQTIKELFPYECGIDLSKYKEDSDFSNRDIIKQAINFVKLRRESRNLSGDIAVDFVDFGYDIERKKYNFKLHNQETIRWPWLRLRFELDEDMAYMMLKFTEIISLPKEGQIKEYSFDPEEWEVTQFHKKQEKEYVI